MKRPLGFRVLALLFGWLALAGFAYAVAAPRTPAAQLRALGFNVPTMVSVGLLYGVSASAAAVGLWNHSSWARRAILGWAAALFLNLASFQAMIGIAGEPWWLVASPYLVFGALVFLLIRYVDAKGRHGAAAI
jgi:hypothetical protein